MLYIIKKKYGLYASDVLSIYAKLSSIYALSEKESGSKHAKNSVYHSRIMVPKNIKSNARA